MIQVITGDIIDSEKLNNSQRQQLRACLDAFNGESPSQFEYFIRGDGLQILVNGNGLQEAIALKAHLFVQMAVQLRLAIGIGEYYFLEERLSDSVGEAFLISGKALDQMKKFKQRISVTSANPNLNQEWEIHCRVLDLLEAERSPNRTEVLSGLLRNETQQKIADRLKISQPSVNQRIKGLKWNVIELMFGRYQGHFLNNP